MEYAVENFEMLRVFTAWLTLDTDGMKGGILFTTSYVSFNISYVCLKLISFDI